MGFLSKLFGTKSKPQQNAITLIGLSLFDLPEAELIIKDAQRVLTLTNTANMSMTEGSYDDAKKMMQAATLLCYESESLGPDHPVTIFTQSGLSNFFFMLGEVDPGFENGLDAFQKGYNHFGPQHEFTTQLAWNTYYIMAAATSDFEALLKFQQNHLNWLFNTNESELTEQQKTVRQALAEFQGLDLEDLALDTTSEATRDINIVPKITPAPAEQNLSNPIFQLGIHIEEFYCLFGEQMQVKLGDKGFGERSLEVQERKLGMAKDTLIDLEIDDDLIMALFHAEDFLKRIASDWSATGRKTFMAESLEIANELDELMKRIRAELDDTTGPQYDLGIFFARIGFCAMYILVQAEILPEPHKTQFKELYTAELIRAGTNFTQILVTVGGDFLDQVFAPIYIERFVTLAKMISGKTNLQHSEVETIYHLVEEVMALQGLM